MATAILFKNADLYAPEHKGIKQILTVNEKIIAVEDEISADLPGLEVIDLNGAIVTPGLIDQHIHVTGGGGEGGPLTRAWWTSSWAMRTRRGCMPGTASGKLRLR